MNHRNKTAAAVMALSVCMLTACVPDGTAGRAAPEILTENDTDVRSLKPMITTLLRIYNR